MRVNLLVGTDVGEGGRRLAVDEMEKLFIDGHISRSSGPRDPDSLEWPSVNMEACNW